MTIQTTDNPMLAQATSISNQAKTIDTTIQTPVPVKSKGVGMLPIIGVAALAAIIVVVLGLYLKNRKQSSAGALPNQAAKNGTKLPLDSSAASASTTKAPADETEVSDQPSALKTDSKIPTSPALTGEQPISTNLSNSQTNQDSSPSSTSSVVKKISSSDPNLASDQDLPK